MEVLKSSLQRLLSAVRDLEGAEQYLVMAFIKHVFQEAENRVVLETKDLDVNGILAKCSKPFNNASHIQCIKANDEVIVTIYQDDGTEDNFHLVQRIADKKNIKVKLEGDSQRKQKDISQSSDTEEMTSDQEDNSQLGTTTNEVDTADESMDSLNELSLADATYDESVTPVRRAFSTPKVGTHTKVLHMHMDDSSLSMKDDSEPYGQIITLDDQGNPVVFEQEIEGDETVLKEVPLKRSRSKRVESTDENLTCKQCGRKFPHFSNLKVHLRVHTGEAPYSCNVCEKRFTTKQNRERHENTTHRGIKAFTCEVCQRAFTEKKSMVVHYRTRHQGERPFKCTICGKAFTQRGPLQAHLMRHATGSTYECPNCALSFTQRGRLNSHLKTCGTVVVDDPTKVYLCDVCSQVFPSIGKLKAHMNVHTGTELPAQSPTDVEWVKKVNEEVWECPSCHELISNRDLFREHLADIHGIEMSMVPEDGENQVDMQQSGNYMVVLQGSSDILLEGSEVSVTTDAQDGDMQHGITSAPLNTVEVFTSQKEEEDIVSDRTRVNKRQTAVDFGLELDVGEEEISDKKMKIISGGESQTLSAVRKISRSTVKKPT